MKGERKREENVRVLNVSIELGTSELTNKRVFGCALVMDRRIDRFIFIRTYTLSLGEFKKIDRHVEPQRVSCSCILSLLLYFHDACILEHSGTFDYYTQRHWLLSMSLHNRRIFMAFYLFSVRCHCYCYTWWLNSTIEFKWREKKEPGQKTTSRNEEQKRQNDFGILEWEIDRSLLCCVFFSLKNFFFFFTIKEIEKNQFQSYCSTVRKIEPNLE